MSSPPRRPLASASRLLEPLTGILWVLFIVWTVLVALVWTLGIGEAETLAWTQRAFGQPPLEAGAKPEGLAAALIAMLRVLDPVWIILAATNVYAMLAAREGLPTARKWALTVIAPVFGVALLSVATNWPLGPVRYTALAGPRLAGVSLGVPLFWFAAIVGARDLVLRLRPQCAQLPLAAATGLLTLLLDFAVEPIAWKVRVFWLWYPLEFAAIPTLAPARNFATWLVLGGVLAYALREREVVRQEERGFASPAAVYGLLLTVFLLGQGVRLALR